MVDLTLKFLGGYHGRFADGRELTLATKKGWALLCYLALHPDQPVSREKLAGLLWSERSEEQARGSLRQTLYELRKALGDDLADSIDSTRATIGLSSARIRVDALRLVELAKCQQPARLAEAAALYQGALLEGMDTDEPLFYEWLNTLRADYHAAFCRILEALYALQLDRGDIDSAIATSRRLVALEPLREPAHRLLMEALSAANHRSEALKHYRELAELLRVELGVEPDADTQALRERLVNETADGSAASRQRILRPATAASAPSPQSARKSKSWSFGWMLAAGCVAVVVATGVGLWLWRPWTPVFEPASVAKMAYPLPDKPSIAVLPFEGLSGEKQDDLIARGLSEDIVTALSNVPELFVISRVSSFAFKDKPVMVAEVAEALGVRYILKGSVQRSGNQIRVNVQLSDAIGGQHVWAERFDGKTKDLFALQDEIVRRITVELQVKLTFGEIARVAARGTTNLDAWLLRVRATTEVYKFTRESTARARELLQAAHKLDPNWARPLGGIAWSYWFQAKNGWTNDRQEWIRRGIAFAERSIKMNPKAPLGYMQLGNLMQLQGNHERAIALREKAVELAPNDMAANWGLGYVLVRAGQAERGVELLKRAERLAPRHPVSLTWSIAWGELFAGRYEDAIKTAKRSIARMPDGIMAHELLVAAYSALGRMQESRAEAAEVLRLNPDFTVSNWKRVRADYKDRAAVDKIGNLLIKAGLPK